MRTQALPILDTSANAYPSPMTLEPAATLCSAFISHAGQNTSVEGEEAGSVEISLLADNSAPLPQVAKHFHYAQNSLS